MLLLLLSNSLQSFNLRSWWSWCNAILSCYHSLSNLLFFVFFLYAFHCLSCVCASAYNASSIEGRLWRGLYIVCASTYVIGERRWICSDGDIFSSMSHFGNLFMLLIRQTPCICSRQSAICLHIVILLYIDMLVYDCPASCASRLRSYVATVLQWLRIRKAFDAIGDHVFRMEFCVSCAGSDASDRSIETFFAIGSQFEPIESGEILKVQLFTICATKLSSIPMAIHALHTARSADRHRLNGLMIMAIILSFHISLSAFDSFKQRTSVIKLPLFLQIFYILIQKFELW